MIIVDEGFILKKIEYGDYDFIITMYTKKTGKASFIAKNARKSKKRFIGKLEPFNLIHISFKYNGTIQSTKVLNDIQLSPHFNNTNLKKELIILCSLVNEYVDTFEIMEIQNSKTFEIVESFFNRISGLSYLNALDLILEFQITYLQSLGLKPNSTELSKINGQRIELSKAKIKENASSRIKFIKIIAKFSQFHSGKELNSIQYLDLL
jgi:DNA repair protein RecO (recombination protein O)